MARELNNRRSRLIFSRLGKNATLFQGLRIRRSVCDGISIRFPTRFARHRTLDEDQIALTPSLRSAPSSDSRLARGSAQLCVEYLQSPRNELTGITLTNEPNNAIYNREISHRIR